MSTLAGKAAPGETKNSTTSFSTRSSIEVPSAKRKPDEMGLLRAVTDHLAARGEQAVIPLRREVDPRPAPARTAAGAAADENHQPRAIRLPPGPEERARRAPAWVLNVTECSWQAGNVRLLRNWTVAGSAPAPPEGVKPTQPPGLSGPACRAGPFLHFPALREAPMQ